jgi:uncharacterized protein YceK
MKKTLLCAAMLALLSGCASIPNDPAQQGRYYAEQSRTELAKGDLVNGFWDMTRSLDRLGGAEHMRAAASDPAVHSKLVEAIDKELTSSLSIDSAIRMNSVLEKIAAAKILSDGELAAARTKFAEYLVKGNESGMIAFTITPVVMSIPQLADPKQMNIVYERTIRSYQDRAFSARDMNTLVAYVQSKPERLGDFKAALPKMNVRASELDQVALLDPSFANNRKAQLSLKAHVSVKNADRLFADDVTSRLSQDIHGITWVSSEQPGALELVIERVRDSEKVLPVESRTVTYSYYQVDLLKAALLMPKNASYLFDLKSGGAELDFGYVVSAWKNGVKLQENVIRGKLGGSYRKCENARIVNVFGGISSAGFIANSDMESACSGQREISMESLRSELLGKISAGVGGIPEISEVHSMNM